MSQATDAVDALLATASPPTGVDRDTESFRDFTREALSDIRSKLEDNRDEAERMGMDVDESVDTVLATDNVRDVDVRARRFENPRVTVWLKDCPTWANDAGKSYCYPRGLNAYNGKTNYVWDVRPF